MFSTLSALSAPQTKISVQSQSRLPQPPQAVSLDNPQDSVHFGLRAPVRLALATVGAATIALTASACGGTDTRQGDTTSKPASHTASASATPGTQSPAATSETTKATQEATASPQSYIKAGAKPVFQDNFSKGINPEKWDYGYPWDPNTNWGIGGNFLNADNTNGLLNPPFKPFKTGSDGITMNCFPITPQEITNTKTGETRKFEQGCGALTSKQFKTGSDGFTLVFKDVNLKDVVGKNANPGMWIISSDGSLEFDFEQFSTAPNTLQTKAHIDGPEVEQPPGKSSTTFRPGFFDEKHTYFFTVRPAKDGKKATISWHVEDKGKLIQLRTFETDRVTKSTEFFTKLSTEFYLNNPAVGRNDAPVNTSWSLTGVDRYDGIVVQDSK